MSRRAAQPLNDLADPALEDRRTLARMRLDAAMDEHKRSFLRMVSHELRTPLNAVIGFSEILACELYGPLGTPQYREYAELIRQSGLKLLKLVNQILEIARLEGHVVDLDMRPELLDHALDDAIGLLGEDVTARRVTIKVEDEGRLPPVLADGRGLRTVLFNLLQNAVVYSPEGGVVTVRAVRSTGRVAIVVTDQGEGVPEDEIPRLLRPFEQGENALTRSSHGAGLGLSICALLAQAMGGGLRLRSAPGEGLTATVILPAA